MKADYADFLCVLQQAQHKLRQAQHILRQAQHILRQALHQFRRDWIFMRQAGCLARLRCPMAADNVLFHDGFEIVCKKKCNFVASFI